MKGLFGLWGTLDKQSCYAVISYIDEVFNISNAQQ